MNTFRFSSLTKRRGATLAGVFSLALGCVALLCGAGSAPIENLLPQGAMQGDLNAGGHSLTNAATVSATNVCVTGLTSQATVGTDSSGNLVAGSGGGGGGGGSITLGTNQSGVLTLSSGVLDFAAVPNTAGGLALLSASDGTADGSIALLGRTDDGNSSVAIGNSSSSSYGGVAIGSSSSSTSYYGIAIGNNSSSSNPVSIAIGNSSSSSGGGIAIGNSSSSGGGGAIGNSASATTGFAGGNSTTETGGGANFCGGTYAGTGIAINADEIAVFNGSGHATLTGVLGGYTVATLPPGVIGQMAYVTDALTPTFGAPLVGGGAVVAKAFFDGTNWINE